MKNLFKIFTAFLALIYVTSCDRFDYKTYPLSIKVIYPEGYSFGENVLVNATNENTSVSFDETVNDNGIATFNLPVGSYSVSVSDQISEKGYIILFNGSKSGIIVDENLTELSSAIEVEMSSSRAGQIIIKEAYIAGCQKNDNSGSFNMDKYIILYNNSSEAANLKGVCLGIINPYNSSNSTNYDYVDNILFYETTQTLPIGLGCFEITDESCVLEPYSQIVVALNGAINHTETYTNSVDLSKSEYYVTYDSELLTNTTNHPVPSANIPTSHYLKLYSWGVSGQFVWSVSCPAFVIFSPEEMTIEEWATSTENMNYYNNKTTATNLRRMLSVDWVVDALEIFDTDKTNKKRLLNSVDAGAVNLTKQQGYTVYRNVNKTATEAIPDNASKLVYGYSEDPNSIDAEKSIANGAKIIYMDTNNSTNDLHQRTTASIK